MQPSTQRRRTRRHGVSRARMLLRKHMGWLPGFPVEVREKAVQWRTYAGDGTAENRVTLLEGDHLRSMEFALTQLLYHFPHALPKFVPDVEGWLCRMDHLLAELKNVIHHGGELERTSWLEETGVSRRWSRRFEKLHGDHQSLSPLLEALLYSNMTGLTQPSLRLLTWIENHAGFLSKLSNVSPNGGSEQSLNLQLMFCSLRDEMPPELQARLIECLSDERVWRLPSHECFRYAENLAENFATQIDHQFPNLAIPERPEQQTVGTLLQALLEKWIAMKPNVRRQTIKLWDHLLPGDFYSQIQILQRQVEAEENRLLKSFKRFHAGPKGPLNKKKRKALKEQSQVVVTEPGPLLLESMGFAVEKTNAVSQTPLHEDIWLKLFDCRSADDELPWIRLFHRWEARMQSARNRWQNFRRLVERLCYLVRRHGSSELLLSHWRECVRVKASRNREFVEELIQENCGAPIFQRTLNLLEELVFVRNLSLGPNLLCSLVEFAKATPDDFLATKLITALVEEEDQSYDEEDIRAALSITEGDDLEEVIRFLKILENEYDLVEPATLLGERFRDPRLRRMVRSLVSAKDTSQILRLARFTQVVTSLGLDVPSLPEYELSAEWIREYPVEFHKELRELCSITPDAQRIAERVLSKNFPRPVRLRQEIAELQERLRLESDETRRRHLALRIDNLTRYLESPPKITGQRLANLKSKLRQRVERMVMETYNHSCHHQTLNYLNRVYRRETLPPTMFQSPYPELLKGILELKGATREYGLQLLFESFDESDWSYLPESRNFAFAEQMESRGINMQPWIGPGYTVAAQTGAGVRYQLQFTRRILDNLLMGFHFETCLAPDSFNFFSTIANAVDLNKQVVYGKTDSGKIIGRCLFALTDQGTILTFHRYAHEESEGFSAAVDRFAEGLAVAMNTTIASTGTVANLVAEDWYDDGAIPIESKYDLQSTGSPIRVLLRQEAPQVLLDRLSDFVGQQIALEHVLEPLLKLEEFQNRPEILPPFVERFGYDDRVDFKIRFRLAVLSHTSGNRPLAHAVFDSLKPKEIVRHLRRWECSCCKGFHYFGNYMEVLGLLNEHNPTLALRILRGTRARDVQRDEQESTSSRRHALATVHRRLGRVQLAQKLAQPV